MRPNCDTPTFHFLSLKSSASGPVGVTLALLLGTFALTMTLALRLLALVFALRLLLVFEPRLASAMSITTSPTPITTIAARLPSIHQTAFDFLRGACVGAGEYCGG